MPGSPGPETFLSLPGFRRSTIRTDTHPHPPIRTSSDPSPAALLCGDSPCQHLNAPRFQRNAHPSVSMQAIFSPCGLYRFLLWDVWDESKPLLAWLLFNPSRAGAVGADGARQTDPTWTKGAGFSRRLGYGGQVFANLYAYVSTDPIALKSAGYPVGAGNDEYILRACEMGGGQVLCAWGSLASGLVRPVEVLDLLRAKQIRMLALGTTVDRLPRHPSRLAYSTQLETFDG